MYDVERWMTLEPKWGNRALSRVDLVYTELFLIPVVTTASFQTCDSFLGDSLEYHQANQGPLHV